MRKNYFFILLIVLLGLVSCKSTPDKTTDTSKTDVPNAEALNALNSAASRAEAARKRAMDFDTPTYFPSEWEEPEAKYNNAGSVPRDSEENIQKAIGLYNEAASSYDSLFEKAHPLYAQAREDEIIAVRDELLATGLYYYFPEYLDGADVVALKAWDKYENKDYYGAKETAAQSLEIYTTLKSGAFAYLARQEIVKRGFDEYDADNFDKADEAGEKAIDAYGDGDIKSAHDNADEALLRYNLVLNTGWAAFVVEKEAAAGAERQKAIDAKANVAVRDAFNAANNKYEQGVASLKAEKYAEAGGFFEDSEAQFIEVTRITEEKRLHAEDAIREAEERAEASDEAARRAEEIIEGGSE